MSAGAPPDRTTVPSLPADRVAEFRKLAALADLPLSEGITEALLEALAANVTPTGQCLCAISRKYLASYCVVLPITICSSNYEACKSSRALHQACGVMAVWLATVVAGALQPALLDASLTPFTVLPFAGCSYIIQKDEFTAPSYSTPSGALLASQDWRRWSRRC